MIIRSGIVWLVLVITLSTSIADNGIVVYDPIQFEMSDVLDTSVIFDSINAGCPRLNIDSGNVMLFIHEDLNHPPASWQHLQMYLDLRSTYLISHGNLDGGVIFEAHASTIDFLSAKDYYLEDLELPEEFFTFVTGSPNWIGLTPLGIEFLMAPDVPDDAGLMIATCYSCMGKDAWGDNFVNPWQGASFLCYPSLIVAGFAAYDLTKVIQAQSCELYTELDLIECDVGSALGQASGELVLFGNETNRWNPQRSCDDWGADFLRIAAGGGHVRWLAEHEQRHSQYVVLGVNRLSDEPDTLAVVDGFGSDGRNIVRSYETSMRVDYRFIRIDEIDDHFLITSSDWIRAEHELGDWPLAPGNEIDLSPRSYAPRCIARIDADGSAETARDKTAADESDRADLVIYTTSGSEALANRVLTMALMSQDDSGLPYRATVYTGSDDPMDAKLAYETVYQANSAFPDFDRPYRQYPIMFMVGDGDTIGAKTMLLDDPEWDSGQPYWHVYSLVTDVDGDMIPDGPLSVLPVRRHAQTQIHCDATLDFNNGVNVDPAGSVAVFLDDYKAGGSAGAWFEEVMFDDMPAYCNALNRPYDGVFRESAYDPDDPDYIETMKADGTALLNSKVGQVWYSGLGTGHEHMTWFLRDDPLNWSNASHWLVFGPTCCAGATWLNWWHFTIQDVIFGNTDGGTCVGGIGQLNAGYMPQHAPFSHIMQEEMQNAEPGDLVCEVALRIQRRMIEEYPEYHEFALGITALGTLAGAKGQLAATAVTQGEAPGGHGFRFRASPTAGGSLLNFTLPFGDNVDLDIYDLQGRLVSRMLRGSEYPPGNHSITWNAERFASGLYFARLRVGAKLATTKVTIVR